MRHGAANFAVLIMPPLQGLIYGTVQVRNISVNRNCVIFPYRYLPPMSLSNDDRVDFKCRTEDKEAWKKAAEDSGRSLSNWIIWTLNKAIETAENPRES